MQRYGLRFVVALATAVAVSSACERKDQPTPVVQTPTSPTPPENPTPPAPAPPQPQPCAFTLAADPDDFGPEGGSTTLRVTTASGCAWSVRIDASWLAVEGTSSGEGPGAVRLVAAPNDSPASRRATVAVGEATFTIAQDGRNPDQNACSYAVSPVAFTLPRDAWTAQVSIETTPGCRWSATSTAPWLRVRSTSGSGASTLTYDAEFNPETRRSAQRVGVIEIRWLAPSAGQNVRVVQWGDCVITASPARDGLPAGASYEGNSLAGTVTIGGQGGRVHFWVLSDPFMGCAWTAESEDTWVNWQTPRLHQINNGDGDLVFTVPANPSTDTRRASVTLGGRFRLTIVQ